MNCKISAHSLYLPLFQHQSEEPMGNETAKDDYCQFFAISHAILLKNGE